MSKLFGTPRKDLNWHRVAIADVDLAQKSFLVIGGTGAIGGSLARQLAARGAQVTVVGRTFRDEGVERISFVKADLTSMAAAQELAKNLPVEELDAVIFANGIMCGKTRVETAEGIEIDLAVSYLSRFVFLRDVVDRLGIARTNGHDAPRIFVMGFPGVDHKGTPDDFNSEKEYSLWPAHENTILGNEALVHDGAKRYDHLRFYGLHPGIIKSDIRAVVLGNGIKQRMAEGLIGLLFVSSEKYAARIVPLLVSPDLEAFNGALFNQRAKPIKPSPSLSDDLVDKVMRASTILADRALLRN